MANAAAANIAHKTSEAQAEYALADAFKAALDILFYEDNDAEQAPLEKEPLAARDPSSPIVEKSIDVELNGGKVARKERAAKLAETVAELRKKHRETARKPRSEA